MKSLVLLFLISQASLIIGAVRQASQSDQLSASLLLGIQMARESRDAQRLISCIQKIADLYNSAQRPPQLVITEFGNLVILALACAEQQGTKDTVIVQLRRIAELHTHSVLQYHINVRVAQLPPQLQRATTSSHGAAAACSNTNDDDSWSDFDEPVGSVRGTANTGTDNGSDWEEVDTDDNA
jgi:hypothetical protein